MEKKNRTVTIDTNPRMVNGVIERQCGICKEMKPLKEFDYNNRRLHNACKGCYKNE